MFYKIFKEKNKMFKLTLILLIVSYSQNSNAQIPVPEVGVCSQSPVITDFDITKVIISIKDERKFKTC